ncbi:nuclear pore complex protein Nup93-like isoform X3 [Varroa jacobsoni]|uniref:Nuclear pore protein n=1 Tax=Varroa destructor TaxID=109461 RepID=A0A7M7J7D2_VARDE|nr:nuclear pore complex protein Nup93-like isoform X3 [Varroa destructor]XP_022647881.1 nuclear pore complex protein Nup93-like isoform X3 [Varroa destructor]XP_022704096.1 nuclear pore complex protein Nup93-like isoform X3 [Varroa jacobsoni]
MNVSVPSLKTDRVGPSLRALVRDSEQLALELNEGQDLPRVIRSVNQMYNDGSQINATASSGSGNREQEDVQAAILMGTRGFNLPYLKLLVDQFPASPVFAQRQSIQKTDVKGFLDNERQNAVISAIAEKALMTQNEINRFIHRVQNERWAEQKRRVLASVEFSTDNVSDQRLQSFNDALAIKNLTWARQARETILTSLGTPIRASLSTEERKYARALSQHNATSLSGAQFGEPQTLIDKMMQAVEQLDITLLWRLLKEMQTSRTILSNDRLPQLEVAKKFLEKKRLEDIRRVVYGNLKKASLGGAPGTGSLIRAYLNVKPVYRFSPDEPLVYGHPVWAVMYHAFRCGDLACAAEAATQAEMFDLVGKLQECQRNPQQRLGDESSRVLRIIYYRDYGLGLNTNNPYARALLAILAGCDVSNTHGDLGMGNIEDYIWLKMCKVLATKTQEIDVLNLADLQSELADRYTSADFDALQRPLTYAYVLLLTAQFERAIGFLYQIDDQRCHAVHMAIALDQLGLLNLTTQPGERILVRINDTFQINMPRLITVYSRRFEMSEPEIALEYYYVLKSQHGALWLQCIIELVLETKAYAKILGRRNPDGGTVNGALEKFIPLGRNNEVRKQVTIAVADAAVSRGFHEEAVALYELADERQKCVNLLIKVLCVQVSQAGSEGSKRSKLQKIAHQILMRYPFPDLTLLMELMEFFDLYHLSKNEEALQVMGRLRLIPLQMADVDVMIAVFCGLNEQIRRVGTWRS